MGVGVTFALHGELAKAVAEHVHVRVGLVGDGEGLHQVVGDPVEGRLGWDVRVVGVVLAMKVGDNVAVVDVGRHGGERNHDGREEESNGGDLHGDELMIVDDESTSSSRVG